YHVRIGLAARDAYDRLQVRVAQSVTGDDTAVGAQFDFKIYVVGRIDIRSVAERYSLPAKDDAVPARGLNDINIGISAPAGAQIEIVPHARDHFPQRVIVGRARYIVSVAYAALRRRGDRYYVVGVDRLGVDGLAS